MRAILAALTHLAQRSGRFTVAEATALYNGLWMVLGFAFLACVVAFWVNVDFGLRWPSLLIAIFFGITAVYLWAKPLHILVVAGVGLAKKVITDATLADEVEKVLEKYLDILKWVLLVVVTFLFFTGTVSFRGSMGSILPILVGLGVVGILMWMWPKVFSGTWGRRIVYGYAILVIVLSFGSLVPGPVWVKYMPYGWDPTNAKPTNTEEALYRLSQKRLEIADADRATELNRITNKVDRREALTKAEERFIADAERSQSKKDSGRPLAVVPQGCTSASPCISVTKTDGSTERANIPQGKSVCFEPFFWSNIQRLGYKTSYKGGPEGGTGVSADTFWFVPEDGIKVPRHWFVQEGVTQC
ncbi:hypothetical protein HY412_01470 [Candidatus Kaiserbacteria bacterium]|nr:hypothetical protein [Candidatus Kaiserbacteria bacterium]